jgi:glutamate synthase domain-containing protein 3
MCNLDLVELETVWKKDDKNMLYDLIKRHLDWTNSPRAKYILEAWTDMIGKFVKVVPIDYRKALEKMRDDQQRDTETVFATEEVF